MHLWVNKFCLSVKSFNKIHAIHNSHPRNPLPIRAICDKRKPPQSGGTISKLICFTVRGLQDKYMPLHNRDRYPEREPFLSGSSALN